MRKFSRPIRSFYCNEPGILTKWSTSLKGSKLMQDFWKGAGIVLMALAVIMGLGWVVQGNDFFMYKWFAPKYEQTRREIFEQTKSYNQGMIQELQNMQFDYVKATSQEQKDSLTDVILHRTADYDLAKMPPDLRQFVEKLRQDRMNAR